MAAVGYSQVQYSRTKDPWQNYSFSQHLIYFAKISFTCYKEHFSTLSEVTDCERKINNWYDKKNNTNRTWESKLLKDVVSDHKTSDIPGFKVCAKTFLKDKFTIQGSDVPEHLINI